MNAPAVQARDRGAAAARARDGPDVPADRAVRESVAHRRPHRGSARRERGQRDLGRRAADAPERRASATFGKLAGVSVRGHRRDRGHARLQPDDEERGSRSCSRSCSGSRSSCCSSRSGRSSCRSTAICSTCSRSAAAYGVLVWIFQEGHLQGLLGFHSNGAVVTWLPLFLFTVLFGLSMDYHVFIVSRDQGARRPRRADGRRRSSTGSGGRRARSPRRRS